MFTTLDDLKKLRFGIIGAGALGGFYGSILCKNGYRVAMLMRSAADDVKANGLSVDSLWGKWHVTPKVFKSAEEMGICDVLLISLKTISNDSLKDIFRYTVGPETLVLTLQNGFGNEEYIESVLPPNSADPSTPRVIGGCSFVCCWRVSNTEIKHTSAGNIEIAEVDSIHRPRLDLLAEMFKSIGVPCAVKTSTREVRWFKLIWNIPFNGLGLVAQADTAVILASPTLLAVTKGIMDEIRAVAAKDGVIIPDSFLDSQFKRTALMGHYKSSMQIDFENKREAEVEAILGEPVRRAQELGVPVPRMEMLYGIAKRLDDLNVQKTK